MVSKKIGKYNSIFNVDLYKWRPRVGEVSAGAALKPGPGADPSDFPSVPSPLEPQPCPGTR